MLDIVDTAVKSGSFSTLVAAIKAVNASLGLAFFSSRYRLNPIGAAIYLNI